MIPLRVHPTNPRYFMDEAGAVVYLAGLHTWQNLQDLDPPNFLFNYTAYLDLMGQHHHNCARLWGGWTIQDGAFVDPVPWLRPGPGVAADGFPKWDVTQLNQLYFDRLRTRVQALLARTMYCIVVLFMPARYGGSRTPWMLANNINGINGDLNGDNICRGEVEILGDPAILAVQETFVRKVVDTVNDLPNVLYEILNEGTVSSISWQYQMIDFLKAYQATKPFQHPVGMTPGGAERPTTADCFASNADWIAPGLIHPNNVEYLFDPPAATGAKVLIGDTDHLQIPVVAQWFWQAFTRGLNLVDMQALQRGLPSHPDLTVNPWNDPTNQQFAPNRIAVGQVKDYADRLDLARMVPRGDLASTTYCLAYVGNQYLVYAPFGSGFTVDLTGATGSFAVEWFEPPTGQTVSAGTVTGGGVSSFTPPFGGEVVLYLTAVSTSGGMAWTASATVPWVTLSASSGNAPSTLAVGVNTAGLPSGTHAGQITIAAASASNSPQVVTVTLQLTPGGDTTPPAAPTGLVVE